MFLRRLSNQISVLRHNVHPTILTEEVCKDLLWWSQFLETFNGKSAILDEDPIETVFTDACDEAAGGVFGRNWFYFNWSQDWPLARHFHINEKEVVAVALAAHQWAKKWQNKKIIVYFDNTATVSAINRGSSSNCEIMKFLRSLFWLSAIFNFHLTAKIIPGVCNIAGDSASRLHLPLTGNIYLLLPFTDYSPLFCHMSLNFLTFLLDRFPEWQGVESHHQQRHLRCHLRIHPRV